MAELRSRRVALREFIRQSNEIEGIHAVADGEVVALEEFLCTDVLTLDAVNALQSAFAPGYGLRSSAGMDVRVGNHLPPLGGPHVAAQLIEILDAVSAQRVTPWRGHCAFESLHPYLDGNGRTGRALWLWQMERAKRDGLALPFLHRFYYQTLDACAREVKL